MLQALSSITPRTRLYLVGVIYTAFMLYQRHQLSSLQRVNFAGQEFLEDSVHGNGTRYRVITRGSDTAGSKAEIEVYARHTGSGFFPDLPASTPYHSHIDQEEALAVLEGEMGYNLNGTRGVAQTGEVLVVPQGTPHSVWCVGGRPMKFMVTLSPARKMDERFFEHLAGLGATYGDVSKIPPLQMMVLFEAAGVRLEGMPRALSWALLNLLPPFARSLGYEAFYQAYVSSGAMAAGPVAG
jgi:mannose-6-phosphate isomerase-like protein (cupin superfamily)